MPNTLLTKRFPFYLLGWFFILFSQLENHTGFFLLTSDLTTH